MRRCQCSDLVPVTALVSNRNSMKDKTAIAGAASSSFGFIARNSSHSQSALVADACVNVLQACGLQASDIDGVCGSSPSATRVISMLGIPQVTWFANVTFPFINLVAAASAAVHAGLCEVVLAYHSSYRLAWNTARSLEDPLRMPHHGVSLQNPESLSGSPAYAAWASRYLYEYGESARQAFAYIAVNGRTGAVDNSIAAMRRPITLTDYFNAPMIREPLCLLDMDVPVDGADAFIVTTAERARDLRLPPVLINAVTLGAIKNNEEDQIPGLQRHGQHVVVEALRSKSDFWTDDIQILFPYDGFTSIAATWIENAQYCGAGEAAAFLTDNWDETRQRIMIDGRVVVNPHGGSLSEGGSQGSGHVREAVHQLQGRAMGRQVDGAERALVLGGGYFFNSQGLTLHRG